MQILIFIAFLILGCLLSFIIKPNAKFDYPLAFTSYGYALWFLYFIILTETIGGIGILLHFKLKTGPLATLGLILIMLGVV